MPGPSLLSMRPSRRHRCSCWLRHRCSGRRRARLSAHRPRHELRSACRLEARPGRGPAGALHTGGALRVPGPRYLQPSRLFTADPPTNFACNSPVTISNHEIVALELQRFLALLNLHPIELHATFVGERVSLPAGALVAGGTWCVPGQALRPRRRPLHGLIRIGCAHADRLCASG